MFRSVFTFELRYLFRSVVFWVTAALFFLLAFAAVTSDGVQIGGSLGAVNRNAPYVVMNFTLVMTLIASFTVVAFVASGVLRDQERGTAGMLFSTPLRKRDYILGRFLGAYVASAGILVAVLLAIFVGSLMPWLDPARVGPFQPGAYAYSFFVLALPNLLLMSAVFFGLATLTRSMMGSYVGLVAFLVGYVVAGSLLSDIENQTLATLLDPFGIGAFSIATRYWTTFERNSRLMGIDGGFLANRILWLAVAAAIFAITYVRFPMTTEVQPPRWLRWLRRRKEKSGEADEAPDPETTGLAHVDLPAPSFGVGAAWAQLRRQAWFETRGILRSVPFIVLLIIGVLNTLAYAVNSETLVGTPAWPRTHLMVQAINASFLLFTAIIVTFYAGELVFRERESDVDGIHDALPVPNWVYWGGKMTALAVVVVVLLLVASMVTVAIQLAAGYTDIEPGLYASGVLGMTGWPFLLVAVLALSAQVVTNQKYLGFLVILVFFISAPVFGALGWTHNLYQYASSPPAPYSDMNGWGHFVEPTAWFYLYWSLAAVVLLVLTHLFWVRTRDTGLRVRLRIARRRLHAGSASVLVVAILGFVTVGSWIFYNTNVLNEYRTPDESRDRQAEYEKRYKVYEGIPQPKIRSVYAEVDIYPEERAIDIRGVYELVNRHDTAIDSVHVAMTDRFEVRELRIPGATPVLVDSVLGYRIYELAEPLEPGGERTMSYDLAVRNPGFTNGSGNTDVVHNGTFINSFEYFPHIGYSRAGELGDPNERRKRDLPPVQRMPAIDDSANLQRTYLSGEGDWVDFETVVSTSADQIALAPGYLEKEWVEDGRRYFRYAMDAPILPFWSYLSADWAVKTDTWNDVEISIYYHPDHPYNVDRMIEASKKSLEYYTREFGPYQHRQVRIVEFPRYATFAQSFPNTIPFSESIGFIARLTDEDAIDYVFYVTAHEIAHQWWAHQVIGANVQGATVLSETMSQYSALMVMEQEYGREKMRRFLRYELDMYLAGRGGERIEEQPLYLVENQGYIHYRKGSLAMYALRDYVGEEALNARIRAYLEDVKFQEAPYTTSLEFLDYVAPAVPPEYPTLLEDLFRTITLWDMRADGAVVEPTDDGRWRVTFTVAAAKYRASGEGRETEVAMADMVDIGVFGPETDDSPPEGQVLYLEKQEIRDGVQTVEVVVDAEPVRVGVDPFNKLIDRNPDDNLTRVGG